MGGEGEGGFGLVVLEAWVRALFDEESTDGEVAFDGGEHEEGPAVLVGEVGVEAGVKGGAKSGFVSAFDQVLCASIGHESYSARCWGFWPKVGPK